MKRITLLGLGLLLCVQLQAQDYVDIVKLSRNNTTLGNLDNDSETSINNTNLEIYYPTRINENLVVLTGLTAENTRLNLASGADRSNLTMTRLNLGVKYTHSEKWSGTYVLLPKLASDFEDVSGNDFQMGALALLGYQKSEMWNVKFGVYASSEFFGATITPLIGFWHRSKDKKFYLNATFPIRADANYALTESFSVGADLLTSIKSYNLSENDAYVQEESIRFALYASYAFLDNALIVRGRVGYDTTDYGLYSENDTIGAQVLTFPLAGDDRTRLNSEFDAALYVGADLIYRFDLSKENAK
jgi:hypothetical protein